MAIIYYPNRVYKGKVPAIDRVMAQRDPISDAGSQNVASTALNVVISNDSNWQLDSIGWSFSNAAPREFSALVMRGRKVVENLNDALWFQVDGSLPQSIVLTPGFYTGTQLATELQTRLNANAAFTALTATFVVTYNVAAGTFTVASSPVNVRYLNVDASSVLPIRDSIAGHLFGFNVTTAFAASITSDSTVFGLDSETAVVSQTSGVLSYYHNDIHVMTVDQALHLTSNSGSDVTVGYVVDYEAMV